MQTDNSQASALACEHIVLGEPGRTKRADCDYCDAELVSGDHAYLPLDEEGEPTGGIYCCTACARADNGGR